MIHKICHQLNWWFNPKYIMFRYLVKGMRDEVLFILETGTVAELRMLGGKLRQIGTAYEIEEEFIEMADFLEYHTEDFIMRREGIK